MFLLVVSIDLLYDLLEEIILVRILHGLIKLDAVLVRLGCVINRIISLFLS